MTVEYFLRGVEVLSQVDDNVASSLIFMTLWHGQMQAARRLAVPAAMKRSWRTTAMLRKSYVNAVRVLRDLTRIGVARFSIGSDRPLRSGRLTKEQAVIGIAGRPAAHRVPEAA